MRRSKFDLSYYQLTTLNMGQLIPVGCLEVLPGDTLRHAVSMLLRVSPLVSPVMHPVQVRLHCFYVPNRLVWDGWEGFITGEDGTTVPTITTALGADRVTDFLGVPQVVTDVNALPVRAYNLIWNEFFRDEDLQGERDLDLQTVARVSWEKDYFTVARPTPQEGAAATVPVVSGAISIAGFRTALADQRERERRSRFGNRYTDYLRYLGVTPSDARIGRPEYLGGGKSVISFSEVLATSDTTQNPVGALKGHGIATVRSRPYRRFFEEHGHVITLLSVRPKHLINDHLPRNFLRVVRDDYFQPENQIEGQQAVSRREVNANSLTPGSVFGYVDRFEEYRRIPSVLTGQMRTSIYSDWHLGRFLPQSFGLNNSFVSCVPPKRPFADQVNNELLGMVSHAIVARRIVSKKAKPL